MVGESGVGGVVLEEAGVGVVKTLELGFDGFGEAIVDHGGGRRRGWSGGSDGGGGG